VTSPAILVIRGGAIGDFLLTLPAIRLLREGLPVPPRLHILGYSGVADIAVQAGFADAARSIEHGSLAPFFAPGAPLDPALTAYFAGFDFVISYLYDPDEHFSGNLRRCGVRNLLPGPHRIEESDGLPAAAQLARPLESLALYLDRPWVSLGLSGPEPTPPYRIAVHPGSGSPRKNWGYERWAETLGYLRDALGADGSFLVVSGEAEAGTIRDFLALLDARSIPHEPLASLPLPELARRLAACHLFLGHDSGISHLAAAADVPCLLLFGPTDPAIWAPGNPQVQTLRAPSGQLAGLFPADLVPRALEQLRIPNPPPPHP